MATTKTTKPKAAKPDLTAGSTHYKYTGAVPLTVYAPHEGVTVCLTAGQIIDIADFGDFVAGRSDFEKVAKTAKLTELAAMTPPQAEGG